MNHRRYTNQRKNCQRQKRRDFSEECLHLIFSESFTVNFEGKKNTYVLVQKIYQSDIHFFFLSGKHKKSVARGALVIVTVHLS